MSERISSALSPFTITPSTGTFSPAFIRMTSPASSSSGLTVTCSPPLSKVAVSLLRSISFVMELREEPTATDCSSSPI